MAEDKRYGKKKHKYNFWHSPLMLIFLFLILALFSYKTIGLVEKERETSKNKISEMNKIDELGTQKDSLTADINTLNSSEGIEAALRDKYQVVKPGEKMVVIVDDQSKDQPSLDVPTDHTFWGFIKRMFGIK